MRAMIEEARRRLRDQVRKTPLLEVPADLLGEERGRLLLKLECLQVSGSFKARGARHFISRLLDGAPPAGVVTWSSGNHGRAVAEAARDAGLPAVVAVPDAVDASKRDSIAAAGAEVVCAGPTSASRERAALEIARKRGFAPIPPFDHEWIIAGQGTAALEILEDAPGVTDIWVPIGGGGLAAGIAAALQGQVPRIGVHGVEPVGAAPYAASIEAGERHALQSTESVADGLLPLAVGERNWRILRGAGAESHTVTEARILRSLRLLRLRLEVPAEPSGAVAATPLLAPEVKGTKGDAEVARSLEGERGAGALHVAIVSGGNVAAERLEGLLGGSTA